MFGFGRVTSVGKSGRLFLAGLLPLALLGGCVSSGIVGQGALVREQEPEIPIYKRVVVNNPGLGRDVAVTNVQLAQIGTILKAAVTIESMTGSSLPLQYRFVWIDAKGFEIAPDSGGWKPVTLYGRESRQLQGVAPTPEAIEFMLKIRQDR